MCACCSHLNFIDNMVSLLEKYSSNLEETVAQRTRQLADEKERADQLLFQMLPR
jgi:nitrate/nitrite-specific signal transduction histidine kinase